MGQESGVLTGKPGKPSVPFPGGPSSPCGEELPRLRMVPEGLHQPGKHALRGTARPCRLCSRRGSACGDHRDLSGSSSHGASGPRGTVACGECTSPDTTTGTLTPTRKLLGRGPRLETTASAAPAARRQPHPGPEPLGPPLTLSPISPGSPGGPAGPGAPLEP